MTKVASPKGIDIFEFIEDTDIYASMYLYQLDTWVDNLIKEDEFNNNRLDLSAKEIYDDYSGMSVLAVINRLKPDEKLHYTKLNSPTKDFLNNISVKCTK